MGLNKRKLLNYPTCSRFFSPEAKTLTISSTPINIPKAKVLKLDFFCIQSQNNHQTRTVPREVVSEIQSIPVRPLVA